MATTRPRELYDAFTTTTNSASFVPIKTVPVADNKVTRIEFIVTATQADNTARATFRRVALLYRNGGPVQIEREWHTNETIRTNPGIDLNYFIGAADITLQVKNAAAASTRWIGRVYVDTV